MAKAQMQQSVKTPEGAKSSYDKWAEAEGVGNNYQPSVDRKKGGSQIEYADEDLLVRPWFHEALARRGVQNKMAKHYEKSV